MDKARLHDRATDLDCLADFWERETVETGVTQVCDDYYVDLGAFGEQTMYVELNDDYYNIAVSQIMENAPINVSDLREIVAELRALADEPDEDEVTLDTVLSRMVSTGSADDAWLARILMGVADVLRGFPKAPPLGMPLALPAVPAPWPGALRDDIDYTAADFPLRYLPPPGFMWGTGAREETVTDPHDAVSLEAATLPACKMILDDKGRVSWENRADADFDEGRRWCVWHKKHDGIPSAKEFMYDTPPRALDEDGRVMVESHTLDTEYGDANYNWEGPATADAVAKVLRGRREISVEMPADGEKREEFAPPAPVSI